MIAGPAVVFDGGGARMNHPLGAKEPGSTAV